ncbi:MAG: trehalose 6-phosphate phosphatase [Chloroflexota bacterium]|jgi:trehalose 6-phosphate phosphatase|nr:trehalose 6-phosphate phosphatase [Chloroflexota bacterium]
MTQPAPFPSASARVALRRLAPLLDLRPFLIVSDFDGTLSPIVMDPWGARIVPAARRALRRLAAVDGVHVVLLSGRTALDVASRARIGGSTYVGNHGLERGRLARRSRADGLAVDVMPVDARAAALSEELAREVPRLVADPWLVVERKPGCVAFHFRGAPDVDEAARRVRAAVDGLDPGAELVRFAGRRVLELRPVGAPGKGDAFRSLLAELKPAAAIALGDDATDAAAFEALREARGRDELDGLAIGVQARAEVPAAVTEAADLVLASPAETARFLGLLASSLAATTGDAATGRTAVPAGAAAGRRGPALG